MTPHGPIYCETGHPWLYMAEPVNTITNAFIILAAILAYYRIRNARIGFPGDLNVLRVLLIVTGIGSFLWHGLRTPWALVLDAAPGVLFLVAMSGFWMRMLFGGIAGFFGSLGMLAAAIGSVWLWREYVGMPPGLPQPFMFAPAFATIAIIGVGLVVATDRKFGARAAQLGAAVLVFGVAAAVFRSIDLLVCAAIPFGTHFLWHIGLSTAAYLGITMLVGMKVRGRAVFG